MYATVQEQVGVERAHAAGDGLRRVHLGMIDAVLAGQGSSRVAALAARELDGAVAIVLPAIDLAVIAPPSSERQMAGLRRYVSDQMLGLPAPAPSELVSEVAITSGDERLGSVLLLGRTAPDNADEILQLAALAALTAVTLEQGASQTQARARLALLEFVREVPASHPGEIVARAKRLGCDLTEGASALCVRIASQDAEWALATIAQEFPTALAAQRGDQVDALLPAPAGPARRLARRLRQRLPTGLAPFERDVAALGRALRFAELAVAVGEREDVELDELLAGSWRLLLQVAASDPQEIDALVNATIGPALDPDVSSSADLLQTLRAYLDHDARMNATAAAVHAHRHTIGYRLSRIADLTGHDPQTPSGQSQLTLGLQALALRSARTTSSA
jgi:hypothetical protein